MKEELKQNEITKEIPLDNLNLLNKCEYIDCVIKETLRIESLVIGSFRTLTNDTIINGINLCKGETVLTLFNSMQKDTRNWKLDPTLFIPERFYGNNAVGVNHHHFAFSPFDDGHRVCAGQDLARL